MSEEKRVKDRVRPEVKTTASIRKNGTSKKLAEAFLAEDVANAKSYIFWDVLVPNVRDVFVNTLHSMIDSTFGTRTGGSYGRTVVGANRTNYSKITSIPTTSSRVRTDERTYNTYTFDDILFDDAGTPNLILDELNEIIDEYGMCSVNDYFETVRSYIRNIRIDSNPQDTVYGWTSLRAAKVERAGRGQHYINFPRVRPVCR